jgi:hypothetical protein
MSQSNGVGGPFKVEDYSFLTRDALEDLLNTRHNEGFELHHAEVVSNGPVRLILYRKPTSTPQQVSVKAQVEPSVHRSNRHNGKGHDIANERRNHSTRFPTTG